MRENDFSASFSFSLFNLRVHFDDDLIFVAVVFFLHFSFLDLRWQFSHFSCMVHSIHRPREGERGNVAVKCVCGFYRFRPINFNEYILIEFSSFVSALCVCVAHVRSRSYYIFHRNGESNWHFRRSEKHAHTHKWNVHAVCEQIGLKTTTITTMERERERTFNTQQKLMETDLLQANERMCTTTTATYNKETEKRRKKQREKKWAKLGSLCVCVSFWKQRKCHIECETKRFQNGHNQIGKNYVHTRHTHSLSHMEWAKKINNNNSSSSNSTDTGVDERVNAWNFAFTIFPFSPCFASLTRSLACYFVAVRFTNVHTIAIDIEICVCFKCATMHVLTTYAGTISHL